MGKNRGKIGDNSISVQDLKNIIAKVEKLEEEKSDIGSDIRQVYSEAKGNGFDTKAIRKLIKLRKKSASEIQEEATILGTYANALGIEIDPFS